MNHLSSRPQETGTKFKYAPLPKRLKAFALDYLVILGYIALLAAATLAVVKAAGLLGLSLSWPQDPILADLVAFITLIVPVTLYFTLNESSSCQATWGKRRVGIKVVDCQDSRLTRKRAFVRSIAKLIPWQIAHTSIFQIGGFTAEPVEISQVAMAGFALAYSVAAVYVAGALLSERHRTPYDWLSGAFVVSAKGS